MDLEFDYTVTTEKSFEEAVISVRKEAENRQWTILQVHDFTEILAVKGFEHEPLKIIEICKGKYASKFLKADVMISLCMPCKINVFVENGMTHISAMRPIVLPEFFPAAEVGDLPEEVDDIVREIVDAAK